MLRSNINKPGKSDFERIKEIDHTNTVWSAIQKNIPIYFNKMVEGESGIGNLKTSEIFKIQTSNSGIKWHLSQIFEGGIEKFEKEEAKYKDFFADEKMHDFEDLDDPKPFKSALSTKVPVIHKARNSKREMMQDWKEKFSFSKASDVYAIFFNLIDFKKEFVEEFPEKKFASIDDQAELVQLFTLNEDDDYNVPGVIGMGIKSSVLFHLEPSYFLGANKNTLYGFYFLSDCEPFGLPSGTNEFIMINDLNPDNNKRHNKNMLIDQNYWYPYDLFILYSLRTYRILKKLCADQGYFLDDKYRFIHVNTFMSQIWNMKLDVISTMTGGDQEDAR
jgi:hypothetical protein